MKDETVDQLQTLTSRLQECLVEAKDLRMRLTAALSANVWPDVPSASRRVSGIPGPPRVRPSGDRRTRQRS